MMVTFEPTESMPIKLGKYLWEPKQEEPLRRDIEEDSTTNQTRLISSHDDKKEIDL